MRANFYRTSWRPTLNMAAPPALLALISCATPQNSQPEAAVKALVFSTDMDYSRKIHSIGGESFYYLYDADGRNHQFKWARLDTNSTEFIEFSKCIARLRKVSPLGDHEVSPAYPAVEQCIAKSGLARPAEEALPGSTRFTVSILVTDIKNVMPPANGAPMKLGNTSNQLGTEFEVSMAPANFQKIKQDVSDCNIESTRTGTLEREGSIAQSSYVPMLNYSLVSMDAMVERFKKCLTLRQYAIKQ